MNKSELKFRHQN